VRGERERERLEGGREGQFQDQQCILQFLFLVLPEEEEERGRKKMIEMEGERKMNERERKGRKKMERMYSSFPIYSHS
jgi:hypothetical protein